MDLLNRRRRCTSSSKVGVDIGDITDIYSGNDTKSIYYIADQAIEWDSSTKVSNSNSTIANPIILVYNKLVSHDYDPVTKIGRYRFNKDVRRIDYYKLNNSCEALILPKSLIFFEYRRDPEFSSNTINNLYINSSIVFDMYNHYSYTTSYVNNIHIRSLDHLVCGKNSYSDFAADGIYLNGEKLTSVVLSGLTEDNALDLIGNCELETLRIENSIIKSPDIVSLRAKNVYIVDSEVSNMLSFDCHYHDNRIEYLEILNSTVSNSFHDNHDALFFGVKIVDSSVDKIFIYNTIKNVLDYVYIENSEVSNSLKYPICNRSISFHDSGYGYRHTTTTISNSTITNSFNNFAMCSEYSDSSNAPTIAITIDSSSIIESFNGRMYQLYLSRNSYGFSSNYYPSSPIIDIHISDLIELDHSFTKTYLNVKEFSSSRYEYSDTNKSIVNINDNSLVHIQDIKNEVVIPGGVTKLCRDSIASDKVLIIVRVPESVTEMDHAFSCTAKLIGGDNITKLLVNNGANFNIVDIIEDLYFNHPEVEQCPIYIGDVLIDYYVRDTENEVDVVVEVKDGVSSIASFMNNTKSTAYMDESGVAHNIGISKINKLVLPDCIKTMSGTCLDSAECRSIKQMDLGGIEEVILKIGYGDSYKLEVLTINNATVLKTYKGLPDSLKELNADKLEGMYQNYYNSSSDTYSSCYYDYYMNSDLVINSDKDVLTIGHLLLDFKVDEDSECFSLEVPSGITENLRYRSYAYNSFWKYDRDNNTYIDKLGNSINLRYDDEYTELPYCINPRSLLGDEGPLNLDNFSYVVDLNNISKFDYSTSVFNRYTTKLIANNLVSIDITYSVLSDEYTNYHNPFGSYDYDYNNYPPREVYLSNKFKGLNTEYKINAHKDEYSLFGSNVTIYFDGTAEEFRSIKYYEYLVGVGFNNKVITKDSTLLF